jgi:hypothetical protein
MAEPIIDKLELRRLPFQRRPVAEPGTTLVFRMPDGRVVAPQHPYTAGETWWKGPKWAYVVDVRPHGASFTCELPSSAGAVYFTATVSYSWIVYDAARVVAGNIGDPEGGCRGYLVRQMPSITGGFEPLDTSAAERGLHQFLGARPIDLDDGIRIRDLHFQLRMDGDQAALAKDWEIGKLRQQIAERDAVGENKVKGIHQDYELTRQTQRQGHYAGSVSGGRDAMMALVIAQDPDKAHDILNTMIGLSDRDEQRTLEAIKVLIDGGEIRLGELDGAVKAAVERIGTILGRRVDDPNKALPSADTATTENHTS